MEHVYDEQKVKQAIEQLISGMGEDLARPGIADTPVRVARAWKEWTRGYTEFPHNFSTFPTQYKGMVVRRHIPFSSMCEHHLAYYGGTIDFAYVPDGKVVGISKIIRFMQHYTARLTIQEELTEDLIAKFETKLAPKGSIIKITGYHSCESSRGINTSGVPTITSVSTGVFLDNPQLTDQFYQMIV